MSGRVREPPALRAGRQGEMSNESIVSGGCRECWKVQSTEDEKEGRKEREEAKKAKDVNTVSYPENHTPMPTAGSCSNSQNSIQ